MSIMLRVALLSLAALPAAAQAADPIVFGHRGASAYRPEHTLASYALAIDLGADFIEPDIVSTSDGILIARHENEIGGTTNVSSLAQFAGRQTTKVIDGQSINGWFTEDFTLAELKTLRAKERIPGQRPGSAAFDGQFEVPTLQEVIDLVKAKEIATGRSIGIIPETKHPTYFQTINLALEQRLVNVLEANGYDGEDDLVFIQSFEVGNLIALNQITDIRLVQLTTSLAGRPFDFVAAGDGRTYGDLLSKTGLELVNDYADVIGPEKGLIIPRVGGVLGAPTDLVANAHAAGLLVVPYTFRPENSFLPTDLRLGGNPNTYGNDAEEFRRFLEAGVDGVFADAPDRARAAVDAFVAANAVPEPATWLTMVVGFGLLGTALRARRPGRAVTA